MIAINPDIADIIGCNSVALAAIAVKTEVEAPAAAMVSCIS